MERVVCKVFTPYELCVNERRVRGHPFRRVSGTDLETGCLQGSAGHGGLLPRTRSSTRVAVHGVAKDSRLGGGKRAMGRMHRRALRLHGWVLNRPLDAM